MPETCKYNKRLGNCMLSFLCYSEFLIFLVANEAVRMVFSLKGISEWKVYIYCFCRFRNKVIYQIQNKFATN